METVKDCSYPWTWMMVTADGAVKPCCFSSMPMGNLNDSSAEDVWNGSAAIELRRYIKADKIHPICANAPCKYVQNTELLQKQAFGKTIANNNADSGIQE